MKQLSSQRLMDGVTGSLCEIGCIMSSETDVDKVMYSFSRVG